MANRIYPFRFPGLPITLLLAAFLFAIPFAAATPAVMTSPSSGAVLSGASATFTWSPASGASGYWLDVGTTQGAKDIFGQNAGLATSQTVTGLPTNGSAICVRLWTQQGAPPNATWQYKDYTYTAAGDGGTGSLGSLVTMTSPAAGSKLPGSSVTFTWTGAANITAYKLAVGSAPYQSDLYFNQTLGLATSQQVTGLPTNASTLYVSLYAQVNGAWGDKYYTYTAAGDGGTGSLGSQVMMNSPAAGSKLAGSSVTFSWTGAADITAYQLLIGSAAHQSDLYNQIVGLATSVQVTGLPTDASTLYVELAAQINGAWGDKYYTYTAAAGGNALVNNTSLPQRTVTPIPLASAAVTGTPSAPVAPASMPMAAPQPPGPPGAGSAPSISGLAPGAAIQPIGPAPLGPAAIAPARSTTGPTPAPALAPPAPATSDQTPALLANFPALGGAVRTSFSSTRSPSTWQERGYYTSALTPDSAVNSYAPQLAAAGWNETSRAQSGDAAAQTLRTNLDLMNGPTHGHVVLAQNAKGGTNLALAVTTIFPGNSAPSLATGVTAAPATGATSAPSDRGAHDPADFPRLPGSVRTADSSTTQSGLIREVANYTAKCPPASADAFYAQSLAAGGWDEITRNQNLNDSTRADYITMTWQNAARSAAITLTGSTTGGCDVRVTLTTPNTNTP